VSLAVICPTRDRPDRFIKMAESVYKTTRNAAVLAYIDDDQKTRYARKVLESDVPMFHREYKPRVGRAAAINHLCDNFKEYRAYLLVSDDIEFIRSGWDEEVLMAMASFKDDIGVVHLSTGIPEGWVNWPCVSRKWLDAVGWFNPPNLKHYCQDTALQAMGQALNRIRYIEPPVLMHHCDVDKGGGEHYKYDVEQFLWFMAKDFGPALDRLRKAMK